MLLKTSELCSFLSEYGTAFEYNEVPAFCSSCDPIGASTVDSISWSADAYFNCKDTLSIILILPKSSRATSKSQAIFYVDNPRLVYARIVSKFFLDSDSPTNVEGFIHESATVGNDFKLGHGSILGPNCIVGSNVTILDNVVVHANTVIGDDVKIQSGAIIGSSGFGFIKNELNTYEHFPHVGRVTLKNSVEIGANSCVDRATMGETIIGEGSKISNLCQIAHNVVVGSRCLIAGKAQIGGGSVICDDVYIGPSAIISNKLTIGSKADVKIGSVVIENVDEGQSVSGNFAMPHKRNLMAFMKLKRNK